MSVLFCRKVLDNDSVLICRVDMVPLHEENRCGYLFTLELRFKDEIDRSELFDVTSDPETAEHIFDLICSNNVYPCHLRDIAEDYLANLTVYS